jgi:hypothetical protein
MLPLACWQIKQSLLRKSSNHCSGKNSTARKILDKQDSRCYHCAQTTAKPCSSSAGWHGNCTIIQRVIVMCPQEKQGRGERKMVVTKAPLHPVQVTPRKKRALSTRERENRIQRMIWTFKVEGISVTREQAEKAVDEALSETLPDF